MKEEEILKDLLTQVGAKLEELRRKAGYKSYEAFAVDNDLNRIQYWRMEKGKTNLTLSSLIRVLVIHKLTVPEFFKAVAADSKPRRK